MTTTRSMMGITDIPRQRSEPAKIVTTKEVTKENNNVVFVYTTSKDEIEYKEVPKYIGSVTDLIKSLNELNISEGTFRIKDNKLYIS